MTHAKHASAPLVFITGASSGIGQALAWRYYQAGFRLALVARRVGDMEAWVARQGCDSERVHCFHADVSQVDSIIQAGQTCIDLLGVPDIVIANAGISVGMDTRFRADLEIMSQTFATNTIGMAATFHPFLAGMRARATGVLVGVASVAGIRGLPGHGAYCASKAAAISYLESLRGELRGSGVSCVTLCPGYIDTPLTRQNQYGMPFLMQAEAFADRAFLAISARHSYRVIPWQMGIVAKLLRILPNALFDRLLSGRPRKHRSTDSQT